MIKNIIVICLVCFWIQTYGQSNRDDQYKSMVDSAVVMHMDKLIRNYAEQPFFLIDQNNQPYVLSQEKYRKAFDPAAFYDRKNRRLLKKGGKAWRLIPKLIQNKLTISIIDCRITYDRGNYNFANGGGATVVFAYSCEESKWELKESKWSGI